MPQQERSKWLPLTGRYPALSSPPPCLRKIPPLHTIDEIVALTTPIQQQVPSLGLGRSTSTTVRFNAAAILLTPRAERKHLCDTDRTHQKESANRVPAVTLCARCGFSIPAVNAKRRPSKQYAQSMPNYATRNTHGNGERQQTQQHYHIWPNTTHMYIKPRCCSVVAVTPHQKNPNHVPSRKFRTVCRSLTQSRCLHPSDPTYRC